VWILQKEFQSQKIFGEELVKYWGINRKGDIMRKLMMCQKCMQMTNHEVLEKFKKVICLKCRSVNVCMPVRNERITNEFKPAIESFKEGVNNEN
jgi:hypothetical protein